MTTMPFAPSPSLFLSPPCILVHDVAALRRFPIQ
jgi:hypothetical protein